MSSIGRAAVLAASLLAAGVAGAACVRTAPASGGSPPAFDGPGSFGPLHCTVTLDCLRYVGSIARDGVEHALVRDESGIVYRVKPGDYMGENGGVVRRIDADAIVIEQFVQRGGAQQVVTVRFQRQP